MTAAEKASQKAEIAADERTRSIAVRLDKMEQTLSTSSGVSQGVGASAAILFQIISSLASIGAIIGVIMVLVKH
jgi:hypothetical protein